MKDVLVEIKEGMKEEIAREIAGFTAFCQYSPFFAGRYLGFELVFLIATVYGWKNKKKLTWVDK